VIELGITGSEKERVPLSYDRLAVDLQSIISAPHVVSVLNATSPYTSCQDSPCSKSHTNISPKLIGLAVSSYDIRAVSHAGISGRVKYASYSENELRAKSLVTADLAISTL